MPRLRTRYSFLSHPPEHGRCDAIRDLSAAEELLQIVQYHARDLLPHVESAAGNVRRDDRTRHTAQRIVHTERFHGIGHVESAAQASSAHFFPQSLEIDQAAPRDVNYGRAVRKSCEVSGSKNPTSFIGQ